MKIKSSASCFIWYYSKVISRKLQDSSGHILVLRSIAVSKTQCKCEVFMAVKIVKVFWVVTCIAVAGYRCFIGHYCLYLQGERWYPAATLHSIRP
jgi:hypothetical protein